MANWSESMRQTFEYYVVNPTTWKDERQLLTVKSCSVDRDADADTLGSATIDIDEEIGECYIRAYLVITQNGIVEKHALGTFLVQTPSMSFDGKTTSISLDAYTPLLELKEGMPPIGYYIAKGENVMDTAYRIVRECARAPVVKPTCESDLYYNFISDTSDTWLSFLRDLIADVKYTFVLDELGRILFAPKQDAASLHPVWVYTDDNSSILYPDLSLDHDLYNIPNVVEVVYSNGGDAFYARVVNNDPNSPISTVKRGREIVHRVTDPQLVSDPIIETFCYKVNKILNDDGKTYTCTRSDEKVEIQSLDGVTLTDYSTTLGDKVFWRVIRDENNELVEDYYFCMVKESHQVKEYATQLLKELSTIEYSISYTHGYCPVNIGDCVMLNYEKAGLTNIKAKVISQSIKCEPGCPVTEKATFTTRLWR